MRERPVRAAAFGNGAPGLQERLDARLPRDAERRVYVLLSSLVLILFMWPWRPIPEPVLWHADAVWTTAMAWGVMIAGIGILLLSTFMIDHFDLFGLKQAWIAFRQRTLQSPAFKTPLFYKWVRHPLYVG